MSAQRYGRSAADARGSAATKAAVRLQRRVGRRFHVARRQDGSRMIVDGCSVAPLQPQVPADGVVTVAATFAG